LRYGRAGARVLVGDIHEARGQEVVAELGASGAEAAFLRCEVREDDALERAARWMDERWGGADLVVNNAGVAIGGSLAEIGMDDWRWIVDINLLGVVRGCRAFAPRMARAGGGHILNIASMAGLVHPPLMSAYNATKAAVVALSETLELELAADRVRVSVACPAFFKTNLAETMRSGSPEADRLARGLIDRASRGADEIAELIARGVERGDFLILTHREGTLGWLVKRLLPHPLYRRAFELATRRMMAKATR
jgi:NAD(P)-dependent dehydrogenase (short-subunit alcohol dehydrogenase family)